MGYVYPDLARINITQVLGNRKGAKYTASLTVSLALTTIQLLLPGQGTCPQKILARVQVLCETIASHGHTLIIGNALHSRYAGKAGDAGHRGCAGKRRTGHIG